MVSIAVAVAVAAVAASLLTVAGAIDVTQLNKNTPSGKLATMCGVTYNKAVYHELRSVLDKQAQALEKLGLGDTKADVCAEVVKVANAKMDSKVDYEQYSHAAYSAQAIVGAAILYRTNALGTSLDKDTMHVVGAAFGAPAKFMANWKPGAEGQAAIQTEAKAFIGNALAETKRSEIDGTALENPKLAQFVYDFLP